MFPLPHTADCLILSFPAPVTPDLCFITTSSGSSSCPRGTDYFLLLSHPRLYTPYSSFSNIPDSSPAPHSTASFLNLPHPTSWLSFSLPPISLHPSLFIILSSHILLHFPFPPLLPLYTADCSTSFSHTPDSSSFFPHTTASAAVFFVLLFSLCLFIFLCVSPPLAIRVGRVIV